MPRASLLRSRFPDVRLEKEARALARASLEIHVIAWNRKRGDPLSLQDGGEIRRSLLTLGAPPSSILVPLLLPVWMSYGFVRLMQDRPDTIHAADLDAYLPSILAGKIKRVPVIYDVYDFYADTMDFPFLKRPLRWFSRKIDLLLMKEAAAIILPDRSRIGQIGEDFAERVVYIYNSPAESPTDKARNLAPSEHQGLMVFFGGEVTPDRCLHLVIQALGSLPGVRLKIVGPASATYAARLRDLAMGHDNVELDLDWQRPEFIMENVRAADLLFAIYDTAVPNNRYSSPNKLFEAMMCAKPIIVNAGTSMDQIVGAEECGVVIKNPSPETIREAVTRLKDDPALREKLGHNGRRAYDLRYSWAIMEERLIGLHNRLMKHV